MSKPSYRLTTTYWMSDHSSEVTFEVTDQLPDTDLVSSCFVFPLYDGAVVMSKPRRGWGLPGGHREGDESSEECVRREAEEEASIELGNLELVGRWEIRKRFHSPLNEKYPDLAYQLLYVADVTSLNLFHKNVEISERAVVPLSDVKHVHHKFDEFEDIYNYILQKKGLRS